MEAAPLASPENGHAISIKDIKRKMHFTGSVIKTTLAGAIVDIGLDTPGVIHISQLQKEPVNRVEDVVKVGQEVEVWVRRVDTAKRRIELTMIKPLDLEWKDISKGLVVKGKVTRLEKFGIFVEIGAERPGLVHISELTHGYVRTPEEFVQEGDDVEVMVLLADRRKKQIKLSMKALEEKPAKPSRETHKEKKTKENTEPAPEKEVAIPTAMEMAIRDAMEKANVHSAEEQKTRKRRPVIKNQALENVLADTLAQGIKTTSK